MRLGIGHSSGGREATGMLQNMKDTRNESSEDVRVNCVVCVSSGPPAGLPADAGNQRLGPDWRDDKERLCSSFGFDVLLRGHQVVPLHVVLRVQSVNRVGRLDYLGGHQAWLTSTEAIHGVCEAAVGVVGTDVVIFTDAVRGRTAGARPGHQVGVPVHVVGAFALRGGGAGAGSWRGRAGSQAAVLR